jgi:hypothetical protein
MAIMLKGLIPSNFLRVKLFYLPQDSLYPDELMVKMVATTFTKPEIIERLVLMCCMCRNDRCSKFYHTVLILGILEFCGLIRSFIEGGLINNIK